MIARRDILRARVAFGLALLIAALIYLPGLRGSFQFDDYPNIVDNKALDVRGKPASAWWDAAMASPSAELRRPLAMLSFAAQIATTGLDPVPMKVINLLIHLLNGVLTWLVLRRLFEMAALRRAEQAAIVRTEWLATGVAAAWLLAPINLSGVLLIVQRMEIAAHTAVLLGLLGYLAARRRLLAGMPGAWRAGMATALATGIGALFKESAILLPLYALLIELAVLGLRDGQGRLDRRLLVLFGVLLVLPGLAGLAWLLPRVLTPGAWASRSFDLGERLLTEARVLWDYVGWSLLPRLTSLSLFHDDYLVSTGWMAPPTTLVAAFGWLAWFTAAVLLRRRVPLAALGMAWFFAAHLLTATIVPLELVYEHRNYAASLGLYLAAADLLMCLAPPILPHARRALAAGLIFMFALTTTLRAQEWGDPIRFALSEAQRHPSSPRAGYDLGRSYVLLSQYNATSPFTARAMAELDRTAALAGASALSDQGLLILAARSGLPLDPAWWTRLQDKLRRRALGVQDISALRALVNCATSRDCAFPPEDMVATFLAALDRNPRSTQLLSIYADYALGVLGDAELALRLTGDALAIDPRDPQLVRNHEHVQREVGQAQETTTAPARSQSIGR